MICEACAVHKSFVLFWTVWLRLEKTIQETPFNLPDAESVPDILRTHRVPDRGFGLWSVGCVGLRTRIMDQGTLRRKRLAP